MLFDDIKSRGDRQQNMMAHFQKKADGIAFNEVSVEREKPLKSDKEKGIIKPHINYIYDEHDDA